MIRTHESRRGKRLMGWRRDSLDPRDRMYRAAMRAKNLPKTVDLRPQCPAIIDQLELGSCVGCSTGDLYEFLRRRQGLPAWDVSVLFHYYNIRRAEGTTSWDSGGEIRDGIKALVKYGVAQERTWPYVVNRFSKKPPAKAYQEGLAHQALRYRRLSGALLQLQSCLASGYPVAFGFMVPESFDSPETERTGTMKMPERGEQIIGGHAVSVVGYDNATRMCWIKNSWGQDWGQGGFFAMPYDFLTDADWCADFWTLELVEQIAMPEDNYGSSPIAGSVEAARLKAQAIEQSHVQVQRGAYMPTGSWLDWHYSPGVSGQRPLPPSNQ